MVAALALALSGVSLYLSANMDNLALRFVFVLYLVCIALSALLAIYSVLLLLSRLKYVRWQRSLNTLPVGKKAKVFSFVAFAVVIAICVVTLILLLKPLM